MSVVAVRPVVTRIEAELFARVQRLAAGYSEYTYVTDVILPRRIEDYTARDRQIVITREAEERVEELDCPGNPPSVAKRQTFAIRCHVIPSEKDTTPLNEYRDVIAADVRRTITDATRWHTFGELAINAEWLADEPIISDQGIAGVVVKIAVTYRTDENNPYNVRA